MGNQLLKALGIGGATLGGGAAIHGMGLGRILEPLDYPRQALYNLVSSPMKAWETGDPSHLLGAIPGAAGAVLGGLVGGPLGVLAGSALGGTLQGVGQATGREEFNAPTVSDLTGTEDFLPNLAVGMATDPLTYAGLGGTWGAGKAALGAKKALSPLGETVAKSSPKTLEEAIPVAAHAPPMAQLAPAATEATIPTAKKVVPPFYSRLEEAIGRLPDEMNAQSVMNMLKKAPGGISQEEIEATNLAGALAGKKRVTREELLQHFKGNEVLVQDKMHGMQDYPGAPTDYSIEMHNQEPRYEGYQTPGGSNYRELLLTLPEKPLPEGYSLVKTEGGGSKNLYKIQGPHGDAIFNEMKFESPEQATALFHEKMGSGFQSPHWDEPNVLAHVRFNDRVGPNGEKILHIEEIQSDWHQAGRKHGYLEPGQAKQQQSTAAKIHEDMNVINSERDVLNRAPQTPETRARIADLDNKFDELLASAEIEQADIGAVPKAPFQKNWHELAMKRVIRHAAENGYDRITLNPGEQINKVLGGDAASLGGQKQFYDRDLPNWLRKYAKQFGVEVEPHVLNDQAEVGRLQGAHERLLAKKSAGGSPEELAQLRRDIDATFQRMQQIQGEQVNAQSIRMTPQMRESVLTRGQPLMGIGAGMGGGALMAALMGQQQA